MNNLINQSSHLHFTLQLHNHSSIFLLQYLKTGIKDSPYLWTESSNEKTLTGRMRFYRLSPYFHFHLRPCDLEETDCRLQSPVQTQTEMHKQQFTKYHKVHLLMYRVKNLFLAAIVAVQIKIVHILHCQPTVWYDKVCTFLMSVIWLTLITTQYTLWNRQGAGLKQDWVWNQDVDTSCYCGLS